MEPVISSSLCRFRITDEHLISDKIVKEHIARAFAENRCFEFYIDRDVVGSIRAGDPVELYRERFIDMRNSAFDIISKGDQTVRGRLLRYTALFAPYRIDGIRAPGDGGGGF